MGSANQSDREKSYESQRGGAVNAHPSLVSNGVEVPEIVENLTSNGDSPSRDSPSSTTTVFSSSRVLNEKLLVKDLDSRVFNLVNLKF